MKLLSTKQINDILQELAMIRVGSATDTKQGCYILDKTQSIAIELGGIRAVNKLNYYEKKYMRKGER